MKKEEKKISKKELNKEKDIKPEKVIKKVKKVKKKYYLRNCIRSSNI